jgi:hypothetical protein
MPINNGRHYLNEQYKHWTTEQVAAELKKVDVGIIPTTFNSRDPATKVFELKRELQYRQMVEELKPVLY